MNLDELSEILKESYSRKLIDEIIHNMKIFNRPTYTAPKTDHYKVSGSIEMVDGSKNPIEIGLPGSCIIHWDEDFDQDDGQCKHDWREYHGFTESFQYCTKCDERRDIDEE